MKSCTIIGDLSSDKSSENYPTVPVCDECVQENEDAGENSGIVSAESYNSIFGDKCEFCGKTVEEENTE